MHWRFGKKIPARYLCGKAACHLHSDFGTAEKPICREGIRGRPQGVGDRHERFPETGRRLQQYLGAKGKNPGGEREKTYLGQSSQLPWGDRKSGGPTDRGRQATTHQGEQSPADDLLERPFLLELACSH